MLSANLSAIFYLISGVLFILALRGLSSPETSRQGNFFGILGMIIAVTVTAINIPIIPNKFPCLEVSGDDKPLKAKINNTPDTKYKIADKFADMSYLSFFFFFVHS